MFVLPHFRCTTRQPTYSPESGWIVYFILLRWQSLCFGSSISYQRQLPTTCRATPSDSIGRKELCIGFIYIGFDGPNRIVQRELPHVMIIGAKDNSKRDHRVIQNGLPTSYQYLILVLKLNLEDSHMHGCLRAHIQWQSLLFSHMSIWNNCTKAAICEVSRCRSKSET